MGAKGIVHPEGVVCTLQDKAVAVVLSAAASVDLNGVADGFVDVNRLFLDILTIRVRMRSLKDLLNREVGAFLSSCNKVIKHLFPLLAFLVNEDGLETVND